MAEIIGSLVKFNQSKDSAAALNGNASTVHFTTDGDLVLNGKSYIHSVGNVYLDSDNNKYVYVGGALKQLADEMGALTNGLDGRVEALEHTVDGYTPKGGQHVPGVVDKIKTDGTAPEGSIGDTVHTLNGVETAPGSVRNLIKTKIEGLDVTDTEVEGSVVVAVSEEDGKVSNVKKAVAVTKQETPTEGMQKTYDVTIGEKSVGKIDIPFCDAVLANAVLGKMDSTVNPSNGEVTTPEGSTAHDALIMVFKKADGTYVGVKVDVSTFLVETEFKNGLKVTDGSVSVNFGENNNYLKFGDGEEGKKPLNINVVKLANASSTNTGVADANDVKTTINTLEKKLDDKTMTASGDEWVSAEGSKTETGYNVTVSTKTVELSDATAENNGVATALDVKTAIDAIATFDGAGILNGGVLAEMDRVTSAALNDLNTRMGRNEDLVTDEKTNLVGAINELKHDINTTTANAIKSVKGETGDAALVTASTNDTKDVTIASTDKLKGAVTKAENSVQDIKGETASSTVPVLVSVGAKDADGNVEVKASADLKALYAALIWD